MLDKTTTSDLQIGVSVHRLGKRDYMALRFHFLTPLVRALGRPRRMLVRGQPANGFLLETDDKGSTLSRMGPDLFYIQRTLAHYELSRRPRKVVWVRPSIQGKTLRVPALPPSWIDAEEDFEPQPEALQPSPTEVRLPRNPQTGSLTAPLPKVVPAYQLPDSTDLMLLQTLLSTKLDEARSIIKQIEAKTGLRLSLDRNFKVVVALAGR